MNLDRSIPPIVRPFTSFHLPADTTFVLPSGHHLTRIQAGSQPVVRLEWVLACPTDFPPGTFSLLAKTLLSGTTRFTSLEISEQLEQLGAFYEVSSQLDRITVTVYTLARQLDSVIPIFRDVLENAIFPEEEIRLQQKLMAQQIQLNQEKNSLLANQWFRHALFGADQRQGYILTESDVLALSRDLLVQAYQEVVVHQPFHLFLSGSLTDTEFDRTREHFTQWPTKKSWSGLSEKFQGFKLPAGRLDYPRPASVQASIRMGRSLVSRKHPDYFPLLVANTTLGGYFGSRLMKNIREEKGLTYGISSSLVPSANYGYWVIGTDVKVDLVNVAIEEIRRELQQLRDIPMEQHELETVQNYLLGSYVGSLNTAFDIGDKFKMLYTQGLTRAYYDEYMERIRAVTVEDIQRVATIYWQVADLTTIVVGGN